MFKGIKSGWQLVRESMKVFNHYPKFIVPLLITWLIYAPMVLYLEYWFNWDVYSEAQIYLIVFSVIFIFAFILSFSCSVLLELIQQLESGKQINIKSAFWHTLRHNTLKMLPIIIVWTIIWFILLIIQVLLSKDERSEKKSYSSENAAKTLAGYQGFTFSRAFFEALEKGIRMIVFLILPGIAWENLNFWKSTKKGIAVFKSNLSAFVTGFLLTEFVWYLIMIPPIILFFLSDEMGVSFSDKIWFITSIYIAFAWSYSIYLEQMFAAELYLWNHKWEKEVLKAQLEGRPIPLLNDILKPSILDESHDLL
ncbi:MAG: hypothetical protein AAB526_02065 [Patescibacteria group bacterium]